MITPQNITRHELIGLDVEVTKASNKSLTGKKGAIVNETRNTIDIECDGKTVRIPKNGVVLTARINGKIIEITGREIVGRPEDRIKK